MAENGAEKDLDLIEVAIHRVLRENPYDPLENNATSRHIRDENDKQLLLKLLDQLNSLRAEREQKDLLPMTENSDNSGSENSPDNKGEDNLPTDGPAEADQMNEKISNEEVKREIRNVKKQNKFTHLILGIIFVSNALWRLSELSVVLRIRNKVSHPLKTIGGMITDKMTEKKMGPYLPHVEAPKFPLIEAPSLPHLEMPSVTHILNGRELSESSGQGGHHEEKKSTLLDRILQSTTGS